MENRNPIDDLTMTLVEQALSRPEAEREAYLRSACGANTELFANAWSYIQWEKRMQGFLLDPLYPPDECKPAFDSGQVLINRFRIVREIAQGGMGIVWEAMDEKLDRRVAIKCAKAGYGKQLPPEVRYAREISHPNVCKIFEIHTASTPNGEIDFISMEFLDGETLASRLRREPLPEREARIIAKQLCSGLAEAHRNHLIHGDLKTSNVILTTNRDGSVRAVLTDFGLARMADASAKTLGGTPAYMAPELWNGEKPSVASDIYAFGVILWELRSGRPPSDLGVSSATVPLGERVSWKPPTGHGAWDRIIARCIHRDPARRFQTVAAIADALGPSRAMKWLLAAAATVLLAAASGLITYERATAPAETVHLAVLPFASAPGDASLSGTLLHNTANQLAQLKSTAHTRFRFISLDKVIRNRVHTGDESRVLLAASHALGANLERHGQIITVHAYLTDVRSGVDAQEWTADYKPEEMRYAPTALAALVTETLHLPPPVAGVNAAAKNDYVAGLAALRRDKTMDEALDRFEHAVKADSASALTFAGLAEAQWFEFAATTDKLWLNRSAESVRQAQLRNPDLPQVHRIAGLLDAHEGRYDQAVADYLRAIQLDPRNGDAYRRLGEAYQGNDQRQEALAVFRKAIEVDPQQYRNYRDLGYLDFQQARYEDAVAQFRRAVELAPDEPLIHYMLGGAYQYTGQFAMAEKEIRASLALRETPIALLTLGNVLMYQGRDREAASNIVRALHPEPERSLWWMYLGTAYRRLGLASESTQAYRRGFELAEKGLTNNPRNGWLRAQLAYLCAQQKDGRRAESELAQALKQSPHDADVLWWAAVTYETLGRRNDTLAVLAASPPGVLKDLNRWPDVADLQADPRFKQLLALHGK